MEDTQQQLLQQPIIQTPLVTRKSHVLFIVLGGIILFGTGLIGGYFLATNKQIVNQPTPSITHITPTPVSLANIVTTNWAVYTSPKLGFRLKYPPQYYIRDFTTFFYKFNPAQQDSGFFYITDINSNMDITKSKLLISFTPLNYEDLVETASESGRSLGDTSNLSFREYIERTLPGNAGADGPQGSILSDKISSIKSYRTANGIQGYKLYLHMVERKHINENTEFIKGPIYVLDLSTKHIPSVRGIKIEYAGPPYEVVNELTDQVMLDIVQSIVDSIGF